MPISVQVRNLPVIEDVADAIDHGGLKGRRRPGDNGLQALFAGDNEVRQAVTVEVFEYGLLGSKRTENGGGPVKLARTVAGKNRDGLRPGHQDCKLKRSALRHGCQRQGLRFRLEFDGDLL